MSKKLICVLNYFHKRHQQQAQQATSNKQYDNQPTRTHETLEPAIRLCSEDLCRKRRVPWTRSHAGSRDNS